MLTWKQLPYFLAVARTGSLRAGAAQIGATHATTRRQIDALEARLGLAVFKRSRAGMELTAAGRLLLSEAVEAERHLEAAELRAAGLGRLARGTIRLTAEPLLAHLALPRMVADFARMYPDVDFELLARNDFDDIAGQVADIGIRIARTPPDGVQSQRLIPLETAAYASEDYLAGVRSGAGPQGEGLGWIGFEHEHTRRFRDASPYPAARLRFRTEDADLLVALARAGAGLVLLPVWIEHAGTGLQRIPGTIQQTGYSVWMVVNADLARARHIRLFCAHLRRAFEALGA